jgi:mono/diheme cytochrome c family protein
MRMRVNSSLLVAALAGALLVGAAGCGNDAPLFPTYARDVKPIMEAHCIRCHGAGGMLNGDPYATPVSSPPTQKPIRGDFTTIDGFKGYTGPAAVVFKMYVDGLPMPPPPSSRLDPYDYDTIMTWVANPMP